MCSVIHQDGWNQNHFITPVSTLERDRYRSQPTLPTSNVQMSPVIPSGGHYNSKELKKRYIEDFCRRNYSLLISSDINIYSLVVFLVVLCIGLLLLVICFFSPHLGGSATSSPAMLGIRGHHLNQRRTQSSMQLHNYYGDANRNTSQYTGELSLSPLSTS